MHIQPKKGDFWHPSASRQTVIWGGGVNSHTYQGSFTNRRVNFFLQIGECGPPCDSIRATTMRKVCLGMGAEIHISGKLCHQPPC